MKHVNRFVITAILIHESDSEPLLRIEDTAIREMFKVIPDMKVQKVMITRI